MRIKSYTLNKALHHILIPKYIQALCFEIPYSLKTPMSRSLSFDKVINCSPYRREDVCTYYINDISIPTCKLQKYKYLLKYISLYAQKHGVSNF